jgi:Fe-S cluster assembly protein SufD
MTSGVNTDLLRTAVEALPDDALASARRDAAARFATSGFPTTRLEDWKYTNLADAAELSNEWLATLAERGRPTLPEFDAAVVKTITGAIDAHWLVVRDGVIEEIPGDIDGLRIEHLSNAGELTANDSDGLAAFNAALLLDGLRIETERGQVVDRPIGILYLDHASSQVAQTRVSLQLAGNSALQVVEYSVSADDGRQFTNHVFESTLSGGARLDHVRIQDRRAFHTGVNEITATLGSDATYRHNSFDLGGALTRNDVIVDLASPGSTVELNGLYLASGEQHIDNHTAIHHAVGPATSIEEYRGILGGRARCVFNGKVIVAEGADGTDSSQSNHNLLLSDRAEIDTKPELEIYADEVKCAHGATVGQLDETSLFYLRSRGLNPDQARQVLTRAFAAGTLSALAIEACHEHVAELIDRRLERLVGEA